MAVFGPQVLGKLYLGVLVLGICSSEGSSVTPIYDTDPETRLEEVVRYVGEKPQVLAKAIDILAPEVPGLAEAFQPVPNPGNVSALCDGCLNVISFIKTLIRLGIKFDTVRDDVVLICKLVVPVANMDGDILCPGVIDNFGPLVYDALKKTKKNSKGVCIHMNWCDPYELPSYLTNPHPSVIGSGTPWVDLPAILENLHSNDPFKGPLKELGESSGPEGPLEDILKQVKVLERKLGEALKRIRLGDGDEHPNIAPVIAAMIKRRTKRHDDRLQTALRLAHLTDIHVERDYVTGAPSTCQLPVCCRLDTPGTGSAGPWGSYTCNAPPRTIELFFEFVAGMKPDFVIYSGDNSPQAVWLETQERQLNASRWVAATMERYFPNTTVFPNIGNHENYPVNMYYLERPETQELNREWTKAWQGVAGFGPDEIATLLKSGYYTTLVKPGLRIVAFNSNYGGTGNFYNIINYDRPEYKEMMDWLKRTLAKARKDDERVIICSHHEYGASEIVIEFDELLTAILADYSDIIVLHPVGHVHRDEFRLNFDRHTGKPVGLQLIAQTMNGRLNVNPGFRIVYLDPVTYQLLDYDQYYIDLIKANAKDGKPVPTRLYRATEEYDLPDMSPASFLALQKRMEKDEALLQRYWSNKLSRSGAGRECDAQCAVSERCHMVSPTFTIYRECMRAQQRPQPQMSSGDIKMPNNERKTDDSVNATINLLTRNDVGGSMDSTNRATSVWPKLSLKIIASILLVLFIC